MIHAAFIVSCALLDVVLTTVFSQIFGYPVTVVFSCAFIGILLLSRDESWWEVCIKVILLSIWMDLIHVETFPIYLVSYLIAVGLLFIMSPYFDTTTTHFALLMIVVLFVKEIVLYGMVKLTHVHHESFLHFLGYRSAWVILFAVVSLPLVIYINRVMHGKILQITQKRFMR